ncbi:MAG: GDP-L-fucose synthase family protein [Thermodesulfobacteriota bacterium]
MEKSAKIFVAGHQGLVGSAISRALGAAGYENLLFRTLEELDLRDQAALTTFFGKERPNYVFLAAAKVGGIWANNNFPAEFIYDNLMIQNNVIHQAYLNGVKKLLFLGSSCIYPKFCPQPMKEEYLLDGKLEPSNKPYALAKIAGIEMCQAYRRQYNANLIAVMPTNLYGPGDNFDLQDSHVIPALIRKCHEGKIKDAGEVIVWGTGSPRREFLYVDDLADASLFLMQYYNAGEIINVGTGEDQTIRELAQTVAEVVGFSGRLVFDPQYPDGTPRKLLDVSRLSGMGWRPRTPLREGLSRTYKWFLNSHWANP